MSQVFISHATEDWEFVKREIQALLESQGLSTWCSGDKIPGGSDWEHSIRRGLEESEWFLVAMSRNSLESRWVAREVHWAMEERYERFVPVLLETCELARWHLGIRKLQIVDFTTVTDLTRRRLCSAFGLGSADTAATVSPQPTQMTESAPAYTDRADLNPEISWSGHPSLTNFQYFCYISQSKVNQLLAQIPAETSDQSAIDTALARRISDLVGQITVKRVEGSSKVLALEKELSRLQTIRHLKSLSFGTRSGAGVERGLAGLEDIKSLVTKTRAVLRHVFEQERVQSLEEAVRMKTQLQAFCYFYEGPCRFEDYAGPGMAIISSQVCKVQLQIYCSMKYFSDMSFRQDANGRWQAEPHSLNYPFFSKNGLIYNLSSFLLVTSVSEGAILASPICMMLDSRKGVSL